MWYNNRVKSRRLALDVFVVLVLAGLMGAFGSAPAGPDQTGKRSAKDLPPQHRKWLEEEVVYIITDKEKSVFLQLETDREREIFIEAFWKQRDPDPLTPKNEFKEEHYKRIAYANQYFGRDTPGPGWRSEMGRIHIILGEARSVEKYENLPEVYPTIIWFYDGMAEFGLPGSFSVVFFKKNGGLEYVLYSPIQDGPQNLLVHYKGDMTSYQDAVMQLGQVEPNIAEVSLSLIPGEARFQASPSLASHVLISNRIPAAPKERIKDDYAEKLLRYKDIVEVDYTANWFDSAAQVGVFRDASGTAFIHYLFEIEPRRLTVEAAGGMFHGEFEVNGKIADEKGATVYQFNRVLPLDMSEEQLNSVRAKYFSFQDLFPVVPGKFKLNVLMKNRLSRAFTSLEADVLVPEAGAFAMSTPLLGNRADRNSRYRGQNKAFLLGGVQFGPSPGNGFLPGETAYLFFQLQNPPADVKTGGAVGYTIVREPEAATAEAVNVASVEKLLSGYPDPGSVVEEFPLAGYAPGHYRLKISILGAEKVERLAAEIRFFVSPTPFLPRPWVLSLPLPPPGDPFYVHTLGTQHLNVRNFADARRLLEEARRRDPANADVALDYCRALLETEDYAGVKTAAGPFLAGDRKWDFLQIVGQASQALGEYAAAVALYKDYLGRFGANISVLNRIGDCYLQLDNPAEALVAWERSLQLDPNQPGLKDKIKALKEKR
jgi:GWxTD domain-containing protein